jgi:hypothetical protein
MASEKLSKEVKELLYQALETEKGGVEVYTTALRCAVNKDLKEEWEKYLEQTRNHVEISRHLPRPTEVSYVDVDFGGSIRSTFSTRLRSRNVVMLPRVYQ